MAKLEKIEVSFISLVGKPANKKDIVWKSRDKFSDTKLVKVSKATDEGLVRGIVYEPNIKDADGDWADAETIRKAAHDFLASGRNFNVDENHNKTPSGAAVVESFVNEKGAWEVAIQMDPASAAFQSVKKGDYAGISMMAVCVKKDEEPPRQENEIEALRATVAKQSQEIEALALALKGLPKSRQLVIDDSGNVSITKGDGKKEEDAEDPEVLAEFDFTKLT